MVIPTLLTFANALAGFVSILCAIEGHFVTAAIFIGLAACFDLCDGRLARAWGTSTAFGEQLDSLCDTISFCLAPVVLLYSFFFPITKLCIIALAAYLCAGLFRLARFNCGTGQETSSFQGLSTPVSAFFLVSVILYDQWFKIHFPYIFKPNIAAFFVIFLAWLMVSSIRFSAFKKLSIPKKFIYVAIGGACFGGGIALRYHIPVIFFVLACYIAGHVFLHVVRKARCFVISKFLSH